MLLGAQVSQDARCAFDVRRQLRAPIWTIIVNLVEHSEHITHVRILGSLAVAEHHI